MTSAGLEGLQIGGGARSSVKLGGLPVNCCLHARLPSGWVHAPPGSTRELESELRSCGYMPTERSTYTAVTGAQVAPFLVPAVARVADVLASARCHGCSTQPTLTSVGA